MDLSGIFRDHSLGWSSCERSSAGTRLWRASTGSGNVKVTNSTARLLCPKKALNRTNLTKSNYSGSGRKGKPLEVGIKFLGREKRGEDCQGVCWHRSVWHRELGPQQGQGWAWGGWPRSLHWPLG